MLEKLNDPDASKTGKHRLRILSNFDSFVFVNIFGKKEGHAPRRVTDQIETTIGLALLVVRTATDPQFRCHSGSFLIHWLLLTENQQVGLRGNIIE
ncbi:hypothetical protein [Ruegeria halocynthiae]|uniref:hypothetical protein n=1 Tax=Ruegeria halocynthiae TaxID=985054 RepID=UPI001268A555|nr:hypothetical protein [Ruegeria halocynthiae]